jgi:hypothetical protein
VPSWRNARPRGRAARPSCPPARRRRTRSSFEPEASWCLQSPGNRSFCGCFLMPPVGFEPPRPSDQKSHQSRCFRLCRRCRGALGFVWHALISAQFATSFATKTPATTALLERRPSDTSSDRWMTAATDPQVRHAVIRPDRACDRRHPNLTRRLRLPDRAEGGTQHESAGLATEGKPGPSRKSSASTRSLARIC